MFTHRSFLLLGGDDAGDIVSLIKNAFEIQKCSFSFQQGIDQKGKATTRTYSGQFKISLPQVPPDDITTWALSHRKYMDGVIVMVNDENIPAEKIYFKNAACINFELNYTQVGSSYTSTDLIIQAEKIIVADDVTFVNEWKY